MVKRNKNEKLSLVFCVYPEQYDLFDLRISKPVCSKSQNGEGSMVMQEMDSVKFKNKDFHYFLPNNIGVLLSISEKSLQEARKIFNNQLGKEKTEFAIGTKKKLINDSKIVCDYIEKVQTSIVFSYTALEAFCNLSIPEDYEFLTLNENKKIQEKYDKTAIERWVSLKIKLLKILPEIYQTKEISIQKFWNRFILLEKYRHDIIHQKSITRTEFYKNYFKKNIFEICIAAKEVIKFFYENEANKNTTNPLWPWLINRSKEFPITNSFDSKKVEVVGNLYEGIKK